jgi:hypothetical protein
MEDTDTGHIVSRSFSILAKFYQLHRQWFLPYGSISCKSLGSIVGTRPNRDSMENPVCFLFGMGVET